MIRWLFTCEHGGNAVPARWRHLFAGQEAVLQSHRGWDVGAYCVYRKLTPSLADACFHSHVTRLLVDLNRSTHHRALFSEFSRSLSAAGREQILARYYRPWRDAVVAQIDHWRERGDTVIHISVHSFTPVRDGVARNADIGLLYDPGRRMERDICKHWRRELKAVAPDTRVRMNYPYRGTADGFTTWLRRRHASGYAGIELEINAALAEGSCTAVAHILLQSLAPFRQRKKESDAFP